MDYIAEAERIFSVEKPKHFTDFDHCEECLEHDETLLLHTYQSIGMEELGNPGWHPLCFVESFEGINYYFPAQVRLSLSDPEYVDQLLFHLNHKGRGNKYLSIFNKEQKEFVTNLLKFILNIHGSSSHTNVGELEKTIELWETHV
jgi:hypothetical protein